VTPPAGRGTLVLVVGPSGAGKDSLIAGARLALAHDPGFVFPRRFITRPEDAGGEDHVAVDAAAFARLRERPGFFLSWRAHGLDYGISATAAADLAAGRTVVVNVSRTVLDEARARYRPILVVAVTAPVEILGARLAGRGRESESDIAERLSRAGLAPPGGADVVPLANDGPLAAATARFVDMLRATRQRDAGD
jgi:ribose 1,5-bisphosphokinase